MLSFNEELLFLDTSLSLPLFELKCAGITHEDPTYRISRPLGVNFYTIEYVRSGRGTLHFKDKSLQVSAGEAYILPMNTPVKYCSNPDEPWEKLWLNICGPLPEHLIAAYNLESNVLYHNCFLEREFISILDIIKNFTLPNSLTLFALTFHRICSILYMNRQKSFDSGGSPLAVMLKDHCEKHWREQICLADLAALINRSPVQTLRIFSAKWGCTPEQWLQKKRFEAARQYLLNTTYTIHQVSELTGFRDEFYFSNWFKRKSGMSPGRFRRASGLPQQLEE